jgi:hypothetical protein
MKSGGYTLARRLVQAAPCHWGMTVGVRRDRAQKKPGKAPGLKVFVMVGVFEEDSINLRAYP